jgi:hypothetical protein
MTYSFFEGKEHVKTKMHRNSVNPLARLFYAYYFGVDTSAGRLSSMVLTYPVYELIIILKTSFVIDHLLSLSVLLSSAPSISICGLKIPKG